MPSADMYGVLLDPAASADPIAYTPAAPAASPVLLNRTASAPMTPVRRGLQRCALAGSIVSLILMAFATHYLFNLDAADAAFGNGCGGSPPSVHNELLAALVDQDSVRAIRDNATSTPSGGGTYKSKGDGAACASSDECVGVCADYTGGTGGTGGTGRCMLSEYGSGDDYTIRRELLDWTMFDGAVHLSVSPRHLHASS
jgi:hypothetical protein